MPESFSFDIVSDFDRQELVNALDQVKREISQRYDLKGTNTILELDKENFFIEARLEAYEGNNLVFEKKITDSVPRDNR